MQQMASLGLLLTIFAGLELVLHISSCEGSSYHVEVAKGDPKNDCRAPETAKVTFEEIKIKNNDADVVYQRFQMELRQERFASNRSADNLECECLSQCAKAAARAGFDAFKFSSLDDSWIGFKLNQPLLKCGDFATEESEIIYVKPEFFVYEPTVVPFDEAPYITTDLEDVREYRLSTYIPSKPEYEFTDGIVSASMTQTKHLVFDPRGHNYSVPMEALDVNHCLNDGAYGFRIFVATALYDAALPVTYFINECGNTVKIPARSPPYMPRLVIYSHPGIGCTHYPSDLPDECIVTFETEDTAATYFRLDYPPFESEDKCELNMAITASPDQTNEETKITCDPKGYVDMNGHLKYIITLGSHPSKEAYGFHAVIYVT